MMWGEKLSDINKKLDLKSEGLELEKSDKIAAISFYKKLISNEYFINDYYSYRRLVMLYEKINDFNNQYEIIKQFFESKIYCNNYQLLWFINKFKRLIEKGYGDVGEIDYLLELFEKYGSKNKDIANIPLPIAERIFAIDDIISQERYDKIQQKYELYEIASELKRQGNYFDAITVYEYMIYELEYNNSYRFYRDLFRAYEKINDYQNQLRVINEYFNANFSKTNYSEKWFNKKLDEVNNKIEKNNIKISQNVKYNFRDNNIEFLSHLEKNYPKKIYNNTL